MDSEDIQVLESLAKIGRNPTLVTNYSLHRQGKTECAFDSSCRVSEIP